MEQLISPKVLARVKDMPLIAKTVAEGFLHGLQNSVQRGTGIEFSQYRSYEPGDPLSRIDWKLFARSDRYFIREAERESETTLWLLVDTSASMQLASDQADSWNKLQYAQHLAATLAYIALKQGDQVGLLGLSSDGLSFLPAARGQQHWYGLMSQLSSLQSGGYFPDGELLNQYSARVQQPSLVLVLSDFYQQDQEICDLVAQVSVQHNEVAALQLQSDDELNFNYRGPVRFKDLETEQQILVNAEQIQAQYFENLEQHQQQLDQQLNSSGVELTSINIDQPMDQVLFNYLKTRQRVTHV